MSDEVILPCPFCGAAPTVTSAAWWWEVWCPNRGKCKVYVASSAQQTREEAIAAWNTRARTQLETDLAEILWPDGHSDVQWSAETIEDVARRLEHLRPESRFERLVRTAGPLASGVMAAACLCRRPGIDQQVHCAALLAKTRPGNWTAVCQCPCHKPEETP